jgi:hypothetical protein
VTGREAFRTSPLRSWLIWTAGFLAFPIAGDALAETLREYRNG